MKKRILISAGKGPAECTWVVAKTLKNLLKEAEAHNLTIEIIQHNRGDENGCIRSVILDIKGVNAGIFVNKWEGSILWIGQSPYRKYHKRKNWFIELFELDTKTDMNFDEKDVYFQSTKSSGPGGQHVNKTSSAVRAIHEPTGKYVLVQDSRSQHQNKRLAFYRLKEKFELEYQNLLAERDEETWMKRNEIQRGKPIRVYQGKKFELKKIKNGNYRI